MNQRKETADSISFEEILALPDAVKKRADYFIRLDKSSNSLSSGRKTFQIISGRQADLIKFLQTIGLGEKRTSPFSVWLIGAGTSDYIGRVLSTLLKNEWRCDVQTTPSTCLLTEMDELVVSAPEGARHLWVSFSRSGESFEGVRVIEKALEKYPQIKHLIITCNQNSRMANEISSKNPNVFCLTLDEKVNDLGLAMTSSFTNMVVAGQCLAHIFDLETYRVILETLSEAAKQTLSRAAEAARQIAARDFSRICFLGSEALKAVDDESALKVLELSAGHFSVISESYLGLRHGPLSWLNQDSLVICFLSNNPDKLSLELGLLEDLSLKQASNFTFAILPRVHPDVSKYSEDHLILNPPEWLDDIYRPPIDILFAQCLGLFAALRQNLLPDAPSADGKIQRVVSQINFV